MIPTALFQDRIDAASRAVLEGDFDAYLRCLDLPYLFSTLEADFVLRRAAEVRPLFFDFVAILRRNGVTHYERLARDVAIVRPDRIEGWSYTHLISQGERIAAPFAARCAMVLRGGVWLFTESSYPFRTDRLPLTEAVLREAWKAQGETGWRADAWPDRGYARPEARP